MLQKTKEHQLDNAFCETLNQPSLTIEEIVSMPHTLSQAELANYLSWRLQHPYNSYHYFSTHEKSAEDKQALQPAAVVTAYHNLTKFIIEYMQLVYKYEGSHRLKPKDCLASKIALKNYRKKLIHQAQGLLNLSEVDLNLASFKTISPEKDFSLSELMLKSGNKLYDLTQDWCLEPDFLATILIDKHFVTYTNSSFLNSEALSEKIDYRLYLNPHLKMSLEVIEEIILKAKEQSIPLYFKYYNPLREFVQHLRENILTNRLRADRMVIYSNHNYINPLLSLVADCYANNPKAFADRRSPILTTPVLPGVGLATENGWTGRQSFNGHRSRLFDQTIGEYEFIDRQTPFTSGRLAEIDVLNFRSKLEEVFAKNNVSLHNWSLPASKI